MLQRDAVSCVLLELRVVELAPRENNKLGASLALVKGPARVSYMVIHELIERDTFHVDSLYKKTQQYEAPFKYECLTRISNVIPKLFGLLISGVTSYTMTNV